MAKIVFGFGNFSITSTWTQESVWDHTTSSWTTIISTPTNGSHIKTLQLSKIPSGATIKSVRFIASPSSMSYSNSTLTGCVLQYWIYGQDLSATNENIMSYLNGMQKNYSDVEFSFVIKANKQGVNDLNAHDFSITAHYSNPTLEIEYEYADGTDGIEVANDGVTINYHFSPRGIMANENMFGDFVVSGTAYGLKAEYRAKNTSTVVDGEMFQFSSTSTNNEMVRDVKSYTSSFINALASRATEIEVRFTIYTNEACTAYNTTEWFGTQAYLLKSRVAPTITYTVSDSTGLLEQYGRPIQNNSNLIYTLNVTTDPYSEAALSSLAATWKGEVYPLTDNTFTFLVTDEESVTNTLSFAATDTYGLTGSVSTSVVSYSYAAPKIEYFKVSRYVIESGSPVFGGTGISCALTLKTQNSSLGGQASYSVIFSDGSTQKTIAQGTGNSNLNLTNDLDKLSTYTFSNDLTYTCSITVQDGISTVTKLYNLRKSGAPILDIEAFGVGFGCAPSGTNSAPNFVNNFVSKFNNQVSFSSVLGITSLNIDGTEYVIRESTAGADNYITFIV